MINHWDKLGFVVRHGTEVPKYGVCKCEEKKYEDDGDTGRDEDKEGHKGDKGKEKEKKTVGDEPEEVKKPEQGGKGSVVGGGKEDGDPAGEGPLKDTTVKGKPGDNNIEIPDYVYVEQERTPFDPSPKGIHPEGKMDEAEFKRQLLQLHQLAFDAMKLELCTIPVYLFASWSIKTGLPSEFYFPCPPEII
jgi:hypothetical protein